MIGKLVAWLGDDDMGGVKVLDDTFTSPTRDHGVSCEGSQGGFLTFSFFWCIATFLDNGYLLTFLMCFVYPRRIMPMYE